MGGRRIDWGNAISDDTGLFTITFKKPFAVHPVIFMTPIGNSHSTVLSAKIESITTDGFTAIGTYAANGQTMENPKTRIHWIAFGA